MEYTFISTFLTSLGYNRTEEYMVEIIEEVIARVHNPWGEEQWTDEGNILYGMLVLCYGDYGTSPRGGWIDTNKQQIINELEEELKHWKEVVELEIRK